MCHVKKKQKQKQTNKQTETKTNNSAVLYIQNLIKCSWLLVCPHNHTIRYWQTTLFFYPILMS